MEVVLIYQNFVSLDSDKQQTIIRASLREFGRYGYDKTSIEQVAKAAGISKSMVFHYFGTKLGLYNYLMDYTLECMEYYFGDIHKKVLGIDYLEKYQEITKIKLSAYLKQSEVFEFLTMVLTNQDNVEIDPDFVKKYQKLISMQETTLSELAQSPTHNEFREDIDPQKAKRYINWLFEGFSQQIIQQLEGQPLIDADIDDAWDEFDLLIEDLKVLFYKQTKGESS